MIERWFDWQQRAFGVADDFDLSLGGGRNGGKTTCAIAIATRTALMRPKSRSAYFRQTQGSLEDVVENSIDIVPLIDPDARLKMSDPPVWRFGNQSSCTFAPLSDLKLYRRWQGQNLDGLVLFDEAQQWQDARLPDRILSSCRNSNGLPVRAIYIWNPGDFQWWLYERFDKITPGDYIPFKTENGREAVTIRTTYRDNPKSPKNYADTLAASTDDPVELRAWLNGDTSQIGGAAFSHVLSETNVVRWFPDDYWSERGDWRFYLAYDFGLSHPACALLIAQARDHTRGADGMPFVRGDRVVVDEWHNAVAHDLNTGDGAQVADQAEHIKAMCKTWNCSPYGCGDDSIFSARGDGTFGTTQKEFMAHGVTFEGAGKMQKLEPGKSARVGGWVKLKGRLAAAAPPDRRDRRAVYINAHRTPYLWETIRMLVPDKTNRDDVLKSGQPDHAADALRYGVIWSPPPPATSENFWR
jgi:hypothetical protein